MSLKEELLQDMKAAMKAKEAGKTALSVIRMVRSSIRNTEIDGKCELDDAGVGAVIASVTWDMVSGIIKDKNTGAVLIMIAAFIAGCVFQINVIYIILVCILIGVCRALMAGRRHKS